MGTFDTESGRFLDTTPQAFIRDFALASLVKGHFMANKGYRLPGLPDVSTTWTTVQRSKAVSRAVPLGLRFELLDKAHGRGRMPQRGMIVMTGSSITTTFPAPGNRVRFAIDGLGEVALEAAR